MIATRTLIDKVREIASAEPDVVYDPGEESLCAYVGGRPEWCCLIGRALLALGIADLTWADESHPNGVLNEISITSLLDTTTVPIHPGTGFERRWLFAVQDAQDKRTPWGEAIAYADEYGYSK